jgi:hypothetical protein
MDRDDTRAGTEKGQEAVRGVHDGRSPPAGEDGKPQLPLLNTDYPHVPVSRKADYIVATIDTGRPADAIGYPLRQNAGYRLYRENRQLPVPARARSGAWTASTPEEASALNDLCGTAR